MTVATLTTLETKLASDHYAHLRAEGFTEEHIWEMERFGIISMDRITAIRRGFKVWDDQKSQWLSDGGLYFPFTDTFGQIRFDNKLVAHKRNEKTGDLRSREIKYLSPVKAKSECFLPEGCKVITEGAKDAWAGWLHGGIPTGSIAGVSHTEKALPENCGYTILFDSDGWRNPMVAQMLIKAALWCNGKIQLVPPIEGEPKGGLCEYFKAGHGADDYAELLDGAMWPDEFLVEWAKHFKDFSNSLRADCVRVAAQSIAIMGAA